MTDISCMQMDVRIYNTNTNRIVIETVALDGFGDYEEDGSFIIPGVSTPGSEVKCKFVEPSGSMTGHLFPSEKQQQVLRVPPQSLGTGQEPFDVRVTLIDSANPFVLVDATSISTALVATIPSESSRNSIVESIRRAGAVAMGLASDVETAATTRGTPKVALVYPPTVPHGSHKGGKPDIRIQAYSMGRPHPSLQLTGAVTVAVALSNPDTIVADLSTRPQAVSADGTPFTTPLTPDQSPPPEREMKHDSPSEREVLIEHSKGTIKVGVALGNNGGVGSCAVSRTARRLFEGKVRYYTSEGETEMVE